MSTRAKDAFVTYALLGCPSDDEYRRILNKVDPMGEASECADVRAINAMFAYLEREGKDYISRAVKDVYMFLPYGSAPKNISERVLAYAMTAPADVRTVYRWLRYAKIIFMDLRYPDTADVQINT